MNAKRFLSLNGLGVIALCAMAMGWTTDTHAAAWVLYDSPTASALRDVDCGTSLVCVAVGDGGTAVRTADGKTWSTSTTGVSEDLNRVDVYGSTTALAVGKSGTIILSTDGGATWSSITGVTTENLYGVSVVSSTVMYIGGQDGAIYKTTDGGTTWTRINTGIGSFDVNGLDAYSSTVVYIVGTYGSAYKTTNGGTSWTALTTGTGETLHTVDATSATIAYFGGENRALVKTTNGSTFSSLSLISFDTTETVQEVSCSSSSLCMVAGNAGTVATTSNGGTGWTLESIGTSNAMNGAIQYAVGKRIVAGESGAISVYDAYGPNEVSDFALSSGETSTTDTTPEFKWNDATDDETSVASYEMDMDDDGRWVDLGLSNSYSWITELSVGSHTATIRAIDLASNEGDETSVSFTVTASSSTTTTTDTTAPTVGALTPLTATVGVAKTFTATYSDAVGVVSCTEHVDSKTSSMTLSAGTASVSGTFTSAGSYSAYVTCVDAAGNTGTGSTVTIVVSAATTTTTTDTMAPTVTGLLPTNATVGVPVSLHANVSDNVAVSSCTLYVDGVSKGAMTVGGGVASLTQTFTTAGVAIANAYCVDSSGNATRGSSITITISAATTTSEERDAVPEATVNTLIKMACGSTADVSDPCHAVYYYDGKRHAFPNEKVFFTWYENFDDVIVVTDAFMASITLGKNVTYHPGTRMVKFLTVNTVYAVGTDGELRAIASEEVAKSIWGSTWNKQIDDISDAFYSNYRFGEGIDSTSDFDPEAVEASVTDILDILS